MVKNTVKSTSLLGHTPQETRSIRHLEWSSDLKYTFALLCWVCGIESCTRATILGSTDAKIGIVIPYILLLTICGMPYACMETAIGQYSGKGAVGIWNCCPILKGIGHCSIFSIGLTKIFTNLLCARLMLYFFESFSAHIRYMNCNNSWNDKNCFHFSENGTYVLTEAQLKECRPNCQSSGEQFFRFKVLLERSNKISLPKWQSCTYSLITALITFVGNYDGIRSLERFLIWLVIIPTIGQVAMVIVSLIDIGSYSRGLSYICEVDFKHFLSFEMWSTLFEHIVMTLGFGLGGLSALGSQSPFRKPVYMRGVSLPLANFVTSIFYSLMSFGLLGSLSYHSSIAVKTIANEPENFIFSKLPQAMTFLPMSHQFWVIVLYSNFYLMGMRNLMMQEAILLQTLYYSYPNTMKRPLIWSALSCTLTFFVCFLLLTPFANEFTENFPAMLRRSTLLLANLQISGIVWFYGITNFVDDIHFMLGIRPSLFWQISWTLTPVLFLAVQVYSFIKHFEETSKMLKRIVLRVLAHLLVAAPLIFTLTYVVIYMLRNKNQPWKEMFKPAPDWGPREKSLGKSRQMFAAHSITKEYMYRQNLFKDRFADDEHEVTTDAMYVY